MREYLFREIVLVPIICGVLIQIIKATLYSIVNKRIALFKLAQAGGMPNLHAAVFSSLSAALGIKYGFSSILFSFAAVLSGIVIHDTLRLKGEKGRQVVFLHRIITTEESYRDLIGQNRLRALHFTPTDVLSGAVLGIFIAFALL